MGELVGVRQSETGNTNMRARLCEAVYGYLQYDEILILLGRHTRPTIVNPSRPPSMRGSRRGVQPSDC